MTALLARPAGNARRNPRAGVLYPFAPRTPVLVVPGLHDSGPRHWQTIWLGQHPSFRRVDQADFADPSLPHWATVVAEAIAACDAPPIVVAHSFGCLATVDALTQHGARIAGALLVAPADPDRFPSTARVSRHRLSPPTTLVASTNDPWIKFVKAGALAAAWGSRFVGCVGAGHINADSGLGDWQAGMALLRDVAERAAAAGTVRARSRADLRTPA